MTPEISEFSYGFAVTSEIVGWATLKAAPIFPSLIEEGKVGGGYDVKLDMPGIPLYLQFKRADCLVRTTAREVRKDKLPLTVPFFRFPITHSEKLNQHSLLLTLDAGVNEVFYVAPKFHRVEDINTAWRSRSVVERSIFVRPRDLGRLDSAPHHVAYDNVRAYVCSQPRPIEHSTGASVVEHLRRKLADDSMPLRDRLREVRLSMHSAVSTAREMASLQGQFYQPSTGTTVAAHSEDSRLLVDGRVSMRAPLPVAEEYRDLRDIADSAMDVFETQFVIVQQRG